MIAEYPWMEFSQRRSVTVEWGKNDTQHTGALRFKKNVRVAQKPKLKKRRRNNKTQQSELKARACLLCVS